MLKFFVASAAAVAATVVLATGASAQGVPPNLPCVTWELSNYNEYTPNPDTLFVAAVGWVIQAAGDPTQCLQQGDLIPCWSADPGVQNTWGHHDYLAWQIPNDYCRIWDQGSIYFSNNFYLPKKGPKYETWKWKLGQTGGTVDANAISHAGKVMTMSTMTPPGHCAGVGFTGWAVDKAGKFGPCFFAIA